MPSVEDWFINVRHIFLLFQFTASDKRRLRELQALLKCWNPFVRDSMLHPPCNAMLRSQVLELLGKNEFNKIYFKKRINMTAFAGSSYIAAHLSWETVYQMVDLLIAYSKMPENT